MEGHGGQKKGRRLLQPEAYAILNDYFVNVSQWPDPAAQEDLAERVRCVEGCEFYTARQVYSYFANNRAKIRTVGSDAALPTGDWPRRERRKASRGDRGSESSRLLSNSAAPHSIVQKLDVLLDDEPDPSPEVVEVWAERLGDGVVAEHILTYAFLRRASTCQEAETERHPQPPVQHPEISAAAPHVHLLGSPGSGSSGPVSLETSIHPPPPPCSRRSEAAEHAAPPVIIPPPPISSNNDDEQLGERSRPSATPSQAAPCPPSQSSADADLALRQTENANANVAAGAPVSAIPPPLSAVSSTNTNTSAENVRPDELVERVRAALLEADARGTRESPKTFVDFARWLEGHNADRAAVLGPHAVAASARA